jgi:hypothetical protein
METEAKTILASLKSFQQKIHDMDQEIAQYISNRAEHSRPRFRELIAAIRQFENSIHHLNFGFLNTEIDLRLDNLMHSLLVHERHWVQLFERDEKNK